MNATLCRGIYWEAIDINCHNWFKSVPDVWSSFVIAAHKTIPILNQWLNLFEELGVPTQKGIANSSPDVSPIVIAMNIYKNILESSKVWPVMTGKIKGICTYYGPGYWPTNFLYTSWIVRKAQIWYTLKTTSEVHLPILSKLDAQVSSTIYWYKPKAPKEIMRTHSKFSI